MLLADTQNLHHRFALRVLLLDLFPDENDKLSIHERIRYWLLGNPTGEANAAPDDYFVERLGHKVDSKHQYEHFEALRFLLYLFSKDISGGFETDGIINADTRDYVFLLAFDQLEGREVLFESEKDWDIFAGHLSELFNCLPNLVCLFPATQAQRLRLEDRLEKQFLDRIDREGFELRELPSTEFKSLYTHRLAHWLKRQESVDEPLVARYRALGQPFLPFREQEVIDLAGTGTIRDMLSKMDTQFRAELQRRALEAESDYHFFLNEQKILELHEYDHTDQHLNRVQELLAHPHSPFLSDVNLTVEISHSLTPDGTKPRLELRISRVGKTNWIRIYLGRLGFHFNQAISEHLSSLKNLSKNQNFLWLVRANPFEPTEDQLKQYHTQYFGDVHSASNETRLLGLLHLLSKRDEYPDEEWTKVVEILRREWATTYLAKLLNTAGEKLDAMNGTPTFSTVDQ